MRHIKKVNDRLGPFELSNPFQFKETIEMAVIKLASPFICSLTWSFLGLFVFIYRAVGEVDPSIVFRFFNFYQRPRISDLFA